MTMNNQDDFFRDTQIAAMLGVNPVTVRQWRVKNKAAGGIKYGPPYEYRGRSVVYPKQAFREWCASVKVVGGVPRLNLLATSTVVPPKPPSPENPAQMDLLAGVEEALRPV